MKGLKSTLALIVVLAGLGAYIYFVDSKRDPSSSSSNEKIFAGLETDKIDEVRIKSESGDETTVKKGADGWQFSAPATGKASESEITGVTGGLGVVDINRVIEENATSVKDYGLDPPRIEVEFKSADGKNAGKLQIGAKTAAGGNVYAKRADQPRVFVIPGYHESTFNKSTFDLRDKTLMTFDRSKVDGIDVTVDGRTTAMAKSGENWKITSPIASRADNSAADGLVNRLETAQMKSVASNAATPEELKKFGLDKPQVNVVLKLGSAQATLAVGGKAGEDDVYAKDASKPLVATVEKALVEDLRKTTEDYRLKELFEYRAYTATKMQFTRSGKTITFERVKGADGAADTWKRVTPSAADAEKEKIETLLTGLADIRAQSFKPSRDGTGLDSPVLTVVATFDEGKREERVTFGRSGSDAYAATADPGVSKIDASRLDEAIKTLEELAK